MNKTKLLNAIGMAFSSSNIIFGAKLLDAIKKKQPKLVIISSNMGASQKKKFIDKCKFYNIEYYDDLLNVEELSKALGKEIVVAIGIIDINFYKLIKKSIESIKENETEKEKLYE